MSPVQGNFDRAGSRRDCRHRDRGYDIRARVAPFPGRRVCPRRQSTGDSSCLQVRLESLRPLV